MNIKNYFSYYSEPISAENVFLLTEDILDDLYRDLSEVEQFNVFFHLENEYFFLLNNDNLKEAAHICYLISYYLFNALTPPHSDILALEYAKKSIELNPEIQYSNWLDLVKKGN